MPLGAGSRHEEQEGHPAPSSPCQASRCPAGPAQREKRPAGPQDKIVPAAGGPAGSGSAELSMDPQSLGDIICAVPGLDHHP